MEFWVHFLDANGVVGDLAFLDLLVISQKRQAQIIIIPQKIQIVILFVFIPSLCNCPYNHPSCTLHHCVWRLAKYTCIYRAINDKMHVSEVMWAHNAFVRVFAGRKLKFSSYVPVLAVWSLVICKMSFDLTNEFKPVRWLCFGLSPYQNNSTVLPRMRCALLDKKNKN